jgi:hypothetical protein
MTESGDRYAFRRACWEVVPPGATSTCVASADVVKKTDQRKSHFHKKDILMLSDILSCYCRDAAKSCDDVEFHGRNGSNCASRIIFVAMPGKRRGNPR